MRNNIKNIIYIRRILLVSLLFGMNCSFAMAHTLRVDTLLQNDINRVAYGIQPKWMTTGAVSSVKGNELKSFVPNIANMLNGQIPGLVVQQWGCEPGADSPAMNARGVNTYGSGTGLFIVIDGFQSTEAYFQQLTPQEIESITLLKDASATAIYGSKGANGVLLITTKRGTSDKIKINFSIQSGFQQPLRLPEFLGAYDYATLYNEALVNDGKSPFYTPMDLEAYKTGNDPIFHPDVDWYGTILRKAAPITNYNFTASGSNEYFRYFVLLNVLDDRSLYRKAGNVSDFSKNGTYTRYNFRTNIDVKLSKRLQGAVTLGGTIEDKTNPGTSENTSGMFDLMSSIAPNAFPVYVSTGMYGGNSMYSNPLGDLMQTGYTSYNGRSLQAIFQLKGDLGFITPGLSVNGAVGFNTYFKSYSKKSRQYARYSVDRDNADEIIYTTYGQNTSLAGDESSSSQWRDYSLQASLNYNRTFNGLHNIDAIYLGSYNDYVVTGTDLSYKNIAMGGRVTYSYDKRYIGEFSFGYNGTENFPKGHRFGFFPAGSLGWILSNEAFLKGNPILNYLKLRASYGLLGNENIGLYKYQTFIDMGNGEEKEYGNPEITWEKVKMLNIGADIRLFKDLSLTFDWYEKTTSGMLITPPISSIGGTWATAINSGKVCNRGWEFSANYDKQFKDFGFSIHGGLSQNKNKIIDLFGAPYDNGSTINQIGYALNSYYVYPTDGLLQESDFTKDASGKWIPKEGVVIFDGQQPGDIKYLDVSGPDGTPDNKITTDDRVIRGNDQPDLNYFANLSFNYKKWSFEVLFQGVTGVDAYYSAPFSNGLNLTGDGLTPMKAQLDYWTPENPGARYPRLTPSPDYGNNHHASDYWHFDASYCRVKYIQVGYTFDQMSLKKVGISSIRVYLNAQNPFTFAKESMIDPENRGQMGSYPLVKTYSVGLSLNF